jgi:hypothetical protein
MNRHLMPLAAFLMEPEPPALAGRVIVLDPQGHSRTDAGEGVDHPDAGGAAARAADRFPLLCRLRSVFRPAPMCATMQRYGNICIVIST